MASEDLQSGNNSGEAADAGNNESEMDDLARMEAELKEQEEEQRMLKQIQSTVENDLNTTQGSISSQAQSIEDKMEADGRSVYVGNVDYAATAEELEKHFHGCGPVTRVTILCDKFSGHPKGFAYIEFADKDAMGSALNMDDSLFRGRQIKVNAKRTNKPGISTTNRPPFRGRRGRGRGFTGYGRRPRGAFRRRPAFAPY